MRTALAIGMIVCQFGIFVADGLRHDWRTSLLGLLFAAANTIIFFGGKQ